MKRTYITAALVVGFGVLLTPLLMYMAYQERGYWAVGGEFGVLVVSVVMAIIMLELAKDRMRNAKKCRKEDE